MDDTFLKTIIFIMKDKKTKKPIVITHFQGFEDELEHLPEKYPAPEGCILLAWDGLDCVGCAGLRPLSDDIC